MKPSIRKPVVALVGRPNVGKSALFNRLAGRSISIVHDEPGVTRDRVSSPCNLTAVPCDLVDTGGIGALRLCTALSTQPIRDCAAGGI